MSVVTLYRLQPLGKRGVAATEREVNSFEGLNTLSLSTSMLGDV